MKFFRDRADRHRKRTPGNLDFILPPPTGEWPGCPLLRASSDHRVIVGALRARRAPGLLPCIFFLTNPSESVEWPKFCLLHTGCHPQLFRTTYRSSDPKDDHHTRLRRQLFLLYTVCPICRPPLAPPAYLGPQPVLSARTSVSSRTGVS